MGQADGFIECCYMVATLRAKWNKREKNETACELASQAVVLVEMGEN